ncbi:MAG: sugar-binding domain-containing protein [Dehalococcoidales bacterium]|nr:sugar-binding domain-containing protein [Dehalococcoidales bacterium]
MEKIDLEKAAPEIARKRLLKNMSYRALGAEYYVSPATIHRRLASWLALNRFELQDTLAGQSNAHISIQDDELGERLARKTGIWRARVVQITSVESACRPPSTEKPDIEASKASDELHRCLGEVAAELMLHNLRKNMSIGLSSGRGVGFAIEKLAEKVKKTPSWVSGYENIRLVSLCGGAHVGMWEFTHSRDFDADENVFALSAVLKTPRRNISYMTGPISMPKNDRQSFKGFKFNLDMAIIGLGQLNAQHQYFRDAAALQLKEMSEPVRRLIENQSRNPQQLDSVAEIVLRLYPAGNSELTDEVRSIIDAANNSLLAVHPEKIKKSGEIILIAGGQQKVDALYGVLTGNYPQAPIDKKNLTLVTDAWTAKNILGRITATNKHIPVRDHQDEVVL